MDIDIEEVKKFLSTEEGNALIEQHDSIAGLKGKKDELLSKNVALSAQLKKYMELGDLDTLASLLVKPVTPAIDTQATDKSHAEIEHLRNELEKEKNARISREQSMVNSFVDSEIVTAIAKNKGVPELLKHIVASRVKGELSAEGPIKVTVINTDGTPMFKNGKEATVDDLLNEIKANPVYGRAFDADEVKGSGTRPSNGAKVKTSYDFNDPSFNLSEMMKKQKKV